MYIPSRGLTAISYDEVLQEPLARITFSAYPTCHDVNKHTASFTSLDIVIGFNTGDLIWFGTFSKLLKSFLEYSFMYCIDPITGRYVRLNKQVRVHIILQQAYDHSHAIFL